MSRKRIAFICVHNSCRSQMAEGYGLKYLSDEFDVYSAGTEDYPAVKELAVKVMEEDGVDMSNHKPKKLEDIPDFIDLVVTMGCNVECPYLPCDFREDWGLEDPSGGPIEDFRVTRDIVKSKVLDIIERNKAGEFDK